MDLNYFLDPDFDSIGTSHPPIHALLTFQFFNQRRQGHVGRHEFGFSLLSVRDGDGPTAALFVVLVEDVVVENTECDFGSWRRYF